MAVEREKDKLPHVAPFNKDEYEEYMRDLLSPQEIRDRAKRTQEMLQLQLMQQGGIGRNPTDANFHSGSNAPKDMSNDKPIVNNLRKKKRFEKRF